MIRLRERMISAMRQRGFSVRTHQSYLHGVTELARFHGRPPDGMGRRCGHCAFDSPHWFACRDRHCPRCQGRAIRRWTERRRADILPVAYHHVVYSRDCLGHTAPVVDYLARYTRRIAITDARILGVGDTHVTLRCRDYRERGRHRSLTLEGGEFVRRFLLHVLPKGLMRVRHRQPRPAGEARAHPRGDRRTATAAAAPPRRPGHPVHLSALPAAGASSDHGDRPAPRKAHATHGGRTTTVLNRAINHPARSAPRGGRSHMPARWCRPRWRATFPAQARLRDASGTGMMLDQRLQPAPRAVNTKPLINA